MDGRLHKVLHGLGTNATTPNTHTSTNTHIYMNGTPQLWNPAVRANAFCVHGH